MTASTSGMSAKRSRLDLRRAAGDDDARARALAPELADGLRGLAHGLRRDGAGVDDDGVVEPGRSGVAAHHLQLVGIEPAAQGDDATAFARSACTLGGVDADDASRSARWGTGAKGIRPVNVRRS